MNILSLLSTASAFTVTLHFAVFPLFVVTVIVAVPSLIPFTVPFESTVAILLSLLFHVTVLSVALLGATVGVSLNV